MMPFNNVELSEREQEILRLVATGASNKQIAQQLVISTNTVKVHLRNIFAKIGVNSRTEATLFAIRQGLVPSLIDQEVQGSTSGSGESSLSLEGELLSTVSQPTSIYPGKVSWKLVGLLGLVILLFFGFIGYTFWQAAVPKAPPQQLTQKPRWQALSPLPSARSGLAAVVYEERIYAIGGENGAGVTGEMDVYTPANNHWQTIKTKPVPVADISACVISGKIYIPGGRLPSGKPTDLFEVYDPLLDQWEKLANLPIPISAYALAALDGKIYLFGGWDGNNYLSSVYEYDPDNDRWTRKADMPGAKAFAAAVVVGGRIQVIGGFNGKQALSSNEAYTPEQDKAQNNPWSSSTPLPEPRYAMGAISQANIVYLIGGKTNSGNSGIPLTYLKNNWQRFEDPPMSIGSGPAVVAMDSYVYVLGGQTNNQANNLNLVFQSIYSLSVPIIIR